MGCSRQTFENFPEEWYPEVLRLKSRTLGTNNEDTLHNTFLQNVDPEVIKVLEARLGPLDGFDTPRLLLEIKHHMVKRSDIGDQVHMMKVTQEPDEPIRTFGLRLRRLAITCNLYSRCGDNQMLLLSMVRGLYEKESNVSFCSNWKT